MVATSILPQILVSCSSVFEHSNIGCISCRCTRTLISLPRPRIVALKKKGGRGEGGILYFQSFSKFRPNIFRLYFFVRSRHLTCLDIVVKSAKSKDSQQSTNPDVNLTSPWPVSRSVRHKPNIQQRHVTVCVQLRLEG